MLKSEKTMKILLCALALVLAACSSTQTKPAAPRSKPSAKLISPCEAYVGRPTPQSFADFDADSDGTASRDELLCQVVNRFNELDKDNDDFISTNELAAAKGFDTKDQNNDGRLSVIEYMWAAEMAMVKADKNSDASLSTEEYAEGFQ
jgi:hypothetical protein